MKVVELEETINCSEQEKGSKALLLELASWSSQYAATAQWKLFAKKTYQGNGR